MTSSSGHRLRALGTQLVAVHDELRSVLEELRERASGPTSRSLANHCLTFCAALTRHHGGEDSELFPALVERDPALTAVIEQLRHDHVLIAGLLAEVDAAVHQLPVDPTAAEVERFRQVLDGLGAILESHFRFEERRIVAVLDRWPEPDTVPTGNVSGRGQDQSHD